MFAQYGGMLLNPSVPRFAYFNGADNAQPTCSAQDAEMAIAYLQRAVELCIRRRQFEAAHGGMSCRFQRPERTPLYG